ncbi:MAG TPA: TIM barrel protein [Pseudonocardiaceae bacterium]|nr:TIM barrel protein [Pseudonocardiaceae bacterium]
MRGHSLRYAVNLSILFTELDLLDRPAAAKAAGFDAVEFWWPFSTATPRAAEVDAFVGAVADAGVQLAGLNFFGGDLPAGERGVVSLPRRVDEFKASVDLAVEIGRRLNCPAFNALYGNRIDAASATEQDAVAIGSLRYAAKRVADIGATVLLEPVSGVPSYPLRTAADVIGVLDRVEAPNIGLLADLYHLSVNGDDVAGVIAAYTDRIARVQIADAPGRGEPGSGELPFDEWLAALVANGYTGYVAAEYKPTVASADSFSGWFDAAGLMQASANTLEE